MRFCPWKVVFMQKKWFVYLLQCSDNSFYCGITPNLEKRIKAHNEGRGAKYTRSRRPVTLLYSEEWPDRSSASKREYEIKQFPRETKENLVQIKKGEEEIKEFQRDIDRERTLIMGNLDQLCAMLKDTFTLEQLVAMTDVEDNPAKKLLLLVGLGYYTYSNMS